MLHFVKSLLPIYDEEMEGRCFLFERVLESSIYMNEITCGSRCSEAVLCLAQSLINLQLDPIKDEAYSL